MSSSGVTNYSVSELEVLKEAASHLGILESGQSMRADDVVVMRRKLNMLTKQWVAQADFAPGLKMWTRRRAYLFLQQDQIQYDIGPLGDECASESYVHTTLTASFSASDGFVTVASTVGVFAGYRVGVALTGGRLEWATVTAVTSTQIQFGTSLSAGAGIGGSVFVYAAKPMKPFEVLSGVLRDTETQDSPIDVNLGSDEYELIPDKQADGTPSQIYFEAKKTGMRAYLDAAPDDVTKVIRLVFSSYVEDTTAQTQDVDFPAEWFRPLSAQLAIDSAPAFGRPVTPELKMLRDESLRMAQNSHPAKSTAFYASEPDWY